MNHRHRIRLVAAVVAVALAIGAAPNASAAATPAPTYTTKPDTIVQDITGPDGKTVTVRLTKTPIRAAGFTFRIQYADGSYFNASPVSERAYVGTVDGDPAAVVSAIIGTNDKQLHGYVTFDRGGTWAFDGNTVGRTNGLTQPASFQAPSSDDPNENKIVEGPTGAQVWQWDVGIDITAQKYQDEFKSDRRLALDAAELNVVNWLTIFGSSANLRPALKRVVVRTDTAASPYATELRLRSARTEWYSGGPQSDANVDDVLVLGGSSGGVAYQAAATSAYGEGIAATPYSARHEIGHTWGPDDYHCNNPEGPTIMSGNAYGRFDGCELRSIIDYRNSVTQRLAPAAPLPGLPPYASLDLATGGGVLHPLVNDHDANGDALSLASVEPSSHLGGTLTMTGDDVTYVPPVGASGTDWFTYVVRDATGRTATGVVVVTLA